MTDQIVTDAITIAAPPDVVFAIVADPRQHSRIDGSGSVQDIVSGPERLSQGAEFVVAMRILVPYRITNRVVEFEEGKRIAWRHMGGHRWRYEFEPVEGGTRVTETFDYSHHPALKARLLEASGMVRRNRAGIPPSLRRLKDAAEADARTA